MIFLTGPHNFTSKKKTANKPITAAVPVNLANKKGCDWLIGGLLFGTEIGAGQLNKSPCILTKLPTYYVGSLVTILLLHVVVISDIILLLIVIIVVLNKIFINKVVIPTLHEWMNQFAQEDRIKLIVLDLKVSTYSSLSQILFDK